MKRFLAVFLTGTLLLALEGCSRDIFPFPSGDALPDEKMENTEFPWPGRNQVSIVSTAEGENSRGEPVLLAEYMFVNNTDEPRSFSSLCRDRASQSGRECSRTVISDEGDTVGENELIEPESNGTIRVEYLLEGKSPVEIEIEHFYGATLKKTIELS